MGAVADAKVTKSRYVGLEPLTQRDEAKAREQERSRRRSMAKGVKEGHLGQGSASMEFGEPARSPIRRPFHQLDIVKTAHTGSRAVIGRFIASESDLRGRPFSWRAATGFATL